MKKFLALALFIPMMAEAQVDTSEQRLIHIVQELTLRRPLAVSFESGAYTLFSPNTNALNSITGNLSGLHFSAMVHPHMTLGLALQDAQSQAMSEAGELIYLDQMLWMGLLATGYLVGQGHPWDLSATAGWGYARSSFTETPGVPFVSHQTGYPWVLRVQGHWQMLKQPNWQKWGSYLPIRVAFGPQTTLDMRTEKLRTTWLWSIGMPLQAGITKWVD